MPARRKKKAGRVKRAARTAATASAEKTKEAILFVYKHRKKILAALKPIAAVVGTASIAIGKPSRSRRRPKKR